MKAQCPECNDVAEFNPVGPYRSICTSCNAVVKNKELTDTLVEENSDASSG